MSFCMSAVHLPPRLLTSHSNHVLQAITAKPDPWAGVTLLNTDIQALYAISIVVFGFNCHANVVSVRGRVYRKILLLHRLLLQHHRLLNLSRPVMHSDVFAAIAWAEQNSCQLSGLFSLAAVSPVFLLQVFYELEHYPHRLITQLPAE